MPAAAAVRRRVRMEMRPEGGNIFRDARLPGGDGADAAGSVITAESSPCKVLVGGGARWATIIAAAGSPAEPRPEGADAAGAVITAESSPCQVLVGGGARLATIVAAAGASAEPWSRPEGTTKTDVKAASAAGEKALKPGRRSTVAREADIRATCLSKGAERLPIFTSGPCARKSQNSEEVKGSPPKMALSVRGTSPPEPTPGVGEERVRSP